MSRDAAPTSGAPRGRGRWLSAAAGAAVAVSVATLASRVVGFGRTLVFSATVGNTATGSAYNRANLVPNVLFEIVAGGVLAAVVVPLLAPGLARADDEGRDRADHVAGALLTWVLTLLVPLAALVALLADPIARALIADAGVSPATVQLGADLLRMFAVQLPLYGIGAVLGGVLHAHRRFLAPALTPLASSLVVVAAYVAFARRLDGHGALASPQLLDTGDRWLLGGGTTLGVAALTLPFLWPVHRLGVRLRPRWRLPDGMVPLAAGLAGAGVAGVLAQQIAVVTVARATRGVDGGRVLTLLGYAQAVTLMPYAVLVVPLITVVFPRVATAAAGDDRARLTRMVATSTRLVLVAGLLGVAGQAAAAGAVERFFTGLDVAGVPGLAWGLVAFAPGVAGLGLITQLTRVLSAAHRPRPVAVGVVTGWLVAAAGSLAVLAPGVGPRSAPAVLGAANSLGMVVGAGLLVAAVRRELGSASVAALARTAALGGLAALLAGVTGGVVGEILLGPAPPGRQVRAGVEGLLVGVAAAGVAVAVFVAVVALLMRPLLAQARQVVRRPSPGTAGAAVDDIEEAR